MKKVVFFNHYNCGDIHNPRGFVRKIIEKVRSFAPETQFVFSHKNDPGLLKDIPFLEYNGEIYKSIDPQIRCFMQDDIAYVNTWYDQRRQFFPRQYGIITIDVLYAIFDEACRNFWGFSLVDISNDPKDFFPVIDYSYFETKKTLDWINTHPGTKILIENGKVLSGQAHNIEMGSIIERLAIEHPDKLFILSHREVNPMPSNVFWTSDIIQKTGTDLNEISFLSQYCDVIVGKASGVFAFCLTQENLFHSNKKYLCFSHLMAHQQKFWLGKMLTDKINYSANIVVSNEANLDKITSLINGEIRKVKDVI